MVTVNLRMRYIGLNFYGDNGKEDGNYYKGFQPAQEFRVWGFRVLGVQGFGGQVWGSGFRGFRFRVVGGGNLGPLGSSMYCKCPKLHPNALCLKP